MEYCSGIANFLAVLPGHERFCTQISSLTRMCTLIMEISHIQQCIDLDSRQVSFSFTWNTTCEFPDLSSGFLGNFDTAKCHFSNLDVQLLKTLITNLSNTFAFIYLNFIQVILKCLKQTWPICPRGIMCRWSSLLLSLAKIKHVFLLSDCWFDQ